MTKSLEEMKVNRLHKERVEKFMNSEGVKNYLEHRDPRLKDSVEAAANRVQSRLDAEAQRRKDAKEEPLSPECYEMVILGGVVYSEYERRTQRENALAEQKAYVEAGNDVFER